MASASAMMRRVGAPLLAVLVGAVVFGAINVSEARAMAPDWGQDLAFFTQIVWSAAHGGPWASPLLLEPQGFFAMVHTHLVLPLVVLVWWVVPRQETLLVLHALFASLALWPAWRLGQRVGGTSLALGAALGLAVFAPFQGLATADFRPAVLFVPGLLGVFAASWSGSTRAALIWAGVALLGRQEASYLIVAAGLTLCVVPWNGWRWRQGLALVALGALSFGLWVWVKPEMFFHFNPLASSLPLALDAETQAARLDFGLRLGRSGLALGLLSPAGLVAALPVGHEMLGTWREWQRFEGPSAHYSAFWLPFLMASAIAGAGRLGRWLRRPWVGALLLVGGNALAFPWVGPRSGPVALREVATVVRADERVAADYDCVHLLAGREVLWNIEQLYLPEQERPRSWRGPWPLTLDDVDVVVAPLGHPILGRAVGWSEVSRVDDHVVLRRPAS